MSSQTSTKREPASNIRPVCRSCGLQPNPKYNKIPLIFFVGKYVKTKFTALDGGNNEYMWSEITGVDGNNLVGKLNNDPVICTHLKDGDTVAVTRDQIIEATDV